MLITQHLALEGKILDAGCGTGLSGKALQTSGIQQIIGIDVSEASLKRAKQTGAYERLLRIDLCQLPLPFTTDAFVGLSCVGVLAYLHQTEAIMREFCRVVRPGGIIVFTQREDVFNDRHYAEVIASLEQEEVWKTIVISEPELYLPGNEEFGDKIRVMNCVLRVTS
jgi:predicted TPR repeat methyltransferase